jgi:hypothetical protein
MPWHHIDGHPVPGEDSGQAYGIRLAGNAHIHHGPLIFLKDRIDRERVMNIRNIFYKQYPDIMISQVYGKALAGYITHIRL